MGYAFERCQVSRTRDPKLFNYSLTGEGAASRCKVVKSCYSRYSSVSDMLDVLGWTPLSQRRQEARLILFYKIITGLAQVLFEGVLVKAYKGTRRKHSMKFRQIGHTTSQSFFSKTISAWNRLAFAEAPSLAVFRSNFL